MLRLILLGGLRLEDADGQVEGRAAQKRRLALLSLLAVPPGHLVSRDKLVGYLWPERNDRGARRLLSTAVYELRRELGEELVLTAGDEVGLNPAAITSDVAEFTRAVEQNDHGRAVEIYHGPFLDGAYPGGSAAFEQWADSERQRYARMYREALETLALTHEREGDLRTAVDSWRRLANEDPCNRRVALGYMGALASVGERARALQFYGVYEALLREEYGAEPDPEVVQVAGRLREDPRTSTPDVPSAAPVPTPPVEPPGATEDAGVAMPDRSSPTRAPPPAGPPAAPPSRSVWSRLSAGSRGAIAALVTAMALAAFLLLGEGPLGEARPELVRVAVLPLENRSGAETEHFALGLTEEILLALAQVEGFRVPGPASAFAYGRREDSPGPRTIARELGVEYLLSGSVRQDDERVRVLIVLTDADSEFVLWTGAYDSRSTGGVGLQEAIAAAVVSQLRPRLGGEGVGPDGPNVLLSRSTEDPQAHRHYLNARGLWYERSPRAMRSALEELQMAVARDPGYARAYAGIADAYNIMGAYDYALIPPGQAYPAARAAAERALDLEPQLAEAHAALGVALFNYDWNLSSAEQELKTALAINSGDSMARHWYSLLLRVTGRDVEAIRQIEEAQERDPRSVVLAASLCRHHYFARRFDRARTACDRALSLDSTHVPAHLAAGMVAVQEGLPGAALASYQAAAILLDRRDAPVLIALEAHARAAAGDTAAARRLYWQLEAAAVGPEYVPPHFLALAALSAGADDEAVAWVERALDHRSGSLLYMPHEPAMDPLWSHPGLQRLIHRASLEGLEAVFTARGTPPR
ncbi:MAG: BTAD domain-containing putative transcriptional regulator [Gemmatimonadota bacterium]